MKLLALDTSTEACSVALNLDGDIVEDFQLAPHRHSRVILPMVEKLLSQTGLTLKQLDAFAFGSGPGAFTGLRVASAVVQALAFAVDRPVIPITTLSALAQQGFRKYGATNVLSAIDARMGEIYWGAFSHSDGIMQPMNEESVTLPEKIQPPVIRDEWFGMGSGWNFANRSPVDMCDFKTETWPRAHDIAILSAIDFEHKGYPPIEKALPTYLRNKVALKTSER